MISLRLAFSFETSDRGHPLLRRLAFLSCNVRRSLKPPVIMGELLFRMGLFIEAGVAYRVSFRSCFLFELRFRSPGER